MLTDLIVAEFKIRQLQETHNKVGQANIYRWKKSSWVWKSDDRIDDCAFKMNQVFSMKVAYKFCYGNACDDIKRDRVVKRRY